MDEGKREKPKPYVNTTTNKKLMDCPACGGKVALTAPTCPHCGVTLNKTEVEKAAEAENSANKGCAMVAIIAIILMVTVGCFATGGYETTWNWFGLTD